MYTTFVAFYSNMDFASIVGVHLVLWDSLSSCHVCVTKILYYLLNKNKIFSDVEAKSECL